MLRTSFTELAMYDNSLNLACLINLRDVNCTFITMESCIFEVGIT